MEIAIFKKSGGRALGFKMVPFSLSLTVYRMFLILVYGDVGVCKLLVYGDGVCNCWFMVMVCLTWFMVMVCVTVGLW